MNNLPLAASAFQAELLSLVTDSRIFLSMESAAVDALWIADCEDLSRGWISPRFWTILGYGDVEATGASGSANIAAAPTLNWRDVAYAEDLREFDAAIRRASQDPDADPVSRVIRFRHASGYSLSTQVTGRACSTQPGGPVDRVVGFHKDLNRSLQLERLLDETNEAARVGAWSWNIATDELYWTRMVYAIHEVDDLNYVPLLADGINFYREGTSRERISEVIRKCLIDGQRWDITLELLTAKGNLRWVRAVGHGEMFEGKVVRMLGSFQDIHEQKVRDMKLAASEALLSESFELAPNGMVIADADGRIELVSKSFCQMVGYSAEELVGQPFSDYTHPDDRANDLRMMEAFRAGTSTSERVQKRYLNKAGETVWADVAVIAIRDDDGTFTNLSAQLVDITEARAAEAYRIRYAFLEDKAREMEQFAYIASHDLRQPVLTLKGYLEALKEDYGADIGEQGGQYVDVMEAAVNRMDNMIRGLLDYSRLSQARTSEPVDLNQVVQEVLVDVESLRVATQGSIATEVLPTVWGHEVELRQVFQNLIANALKFHRPGVPPTVVISTRPVRGGHEFTVTDNGIGIAEADLTLVFALFRRSGQAPANIEGSGIGLASCKTIVERHGGSISVVSQPNVGSAFTFTLLTTQTR